MVSVPSEQGVERSLLSWLDDVGWETHGLDGGRGANVLDETYGRRSNDVIYWDLLREQVTALNEDLTEANVEKFLSSLRRDLDHENLMDGNQEFHELLTKGKRFSVSQDDGSTDTIYVDLINFEQPENNRFHAVNQFSVSRGTTIRPDVSLFVNGIPLVTMELKSRAQDNDYEDAIRDLHDYESNVPRLFIPGLLNVAADTMELRYGAVGAPKKFYNPWSDAPAEYQDNNRIKQAIQALCNRATLLDFLKHFVFYERKPGGLAKIVPRHMQYYAVNEILDRVREGEHDKGLVWHTQGSGKSLTMLYAAENLLKQDITGSPQIFIVVDTDKLNRQMRDDMANLSIDRWSEAKGMSHLQQVIDEGQSEIVLTTIQKFEEIEPDSQSNDEVFVMADEAHRYMDADLRRRLDAALPEITHFGFTGTPVREGEREKDRNTFREFSPEDEDYLHRYTIKQGIDDGLILPVYFTLRHEMEWDVDEPGLDKHYEHEFRGLSTEEKREAIRKNVDATTLAELSPRVDRNVEEINRHYNEHVAPNGWKGMVVTPSRHSAAMYGERLIELRDADDVEVLYTPNQDDADLVSQFHTTSEERDDIIGDFSEEEDDENDGKPSLLVVHNMLLTGFDAPILKTMYLDRNLTNHTLMQAIARTNRPEDGKENGEIVDFQGVFENIDEALDYDAETKAYAARDKDELFDDLVDHLEKVLDIFDGIPKDDSQEAAYEAVERVSTHPQRREFKQGFRRLQNLYESVAPDRRLVTEGIQREYKWLSRIHVAFRRTTGGDDNPEEDMREKTRDILEKHIDVGEIRRDFPTYKLGKEYLEDVEALKNPGVKAAQVAHATQAHLHEHKGTNPRYKRLSERVNDIIERWQGEAIGDPEAVEALKAIEEEILEVQKEAEQRGMNDAEFAIFTHLTEESADAINSEDQAETIAEDIVQQFESEVDRDYPGWQTNQRTIEQIERILLNTLVSEHDLGHLILDDDEFTDAVRRYLTENYV